MKNVMYAPASQLGRALKWFMPREDETARPVDLCGLNLETSNRTVHPPRSSGREVPLSIGGLQALGPNPWPLWKTVYMALGLNGTTVGHTWLFWAPLGGPCMKSRIWDPLDCELEPLEKVSVQWISNWVMKSFTSGQIWQDPQEIGGWSPLSGSQMCHYAVLWWLWSFECGVGVVWFRDGGGECWQRRELIWLETHPRDVDTDKASMQTANNKKSLMSES